MLRRSLVFIFKARFMEADYLRKHYPNSEADGVFKADPSLKDFLRSSQACQRTYIRDPVFSICE
jgi:hypothetical protein